MLYYQGLKEAVKDEISRILEPPTDFGKYSELAIKIDNQLYSRKQERQGRNPGYRPRANQGRPRYQDKTSHGQHSGPMDLDATQRDRPKKGNGKQRDISQVTCYNCQEKGHYSNKCPKPKKDFKPVPEGNRRANAATRQVEVNTDATEYAIGKSLDQEIPHEKTNWQGCYDDECLAHHYEKACSGHFPKKDGTTTRAESRDSGDEYPAVKSGRSKSVDHKSLSWTACYDDSCLTHRSDKDGAGWYPKKPRGAKTLAMARRMKQVDIPSLGPDDSEGPTYWTSTDDEDEERIPPQPANDTPMFNDDTLEGQTIQRLRQIDVGEIPSIINRRVDIQTTKALILAGRTLVSTAGLLFILQEAVKHRGEPLHTDNCLAFGEDEIIMLDNKRHSQLAWVSCIHALCDYHLEEKLSHRWFLSRIAGRAMEPYEPREIGEVVASYYDTRGYVVLTMHPHRLSPCRREQISWKDCRQDDCLAHATDKSQAWRKIVELQKSGHILLRSHVPQEPLNSAKPRHPGQEVDERLRAEEIERIEQLQRRHGKTPSYEEVYREVHQRWHALGRYQGQEPLAHEAYRRYWQGATPTTQQEADTDTTMTDESDLEDIKRPDDAQLKSSQPQTDQRTERLKQRFATTRTERTEKSDEFNELSLEQTTRIKKRLDEQSKSRRTEEDAIRERQRYMRKDRPLRQQSKNDPNRL